MGNFAHAVGDIVAFVPSQQHAQMEKQQLCASLREVPRSKEKVSANAIVCNRLPFDTKLVSKINRKYGNLA